MRGLNALPIDDDVVYRILVYLPAFVDLGSAILSSKSVYSVFQSHPNSIIRAVAYNLIGPALPQALEIACYVYCPPDPSFKLSQPEVDDHCGLEPAAVSVISSAEVSSLSKTARVLHDFEDLFSWRHKDRSSRISKLSPSESWRFSRALARIIHFVQVFSLRALADWDISSSNLAYDEEQTVEIFELSQKEHMQKLNSEELLEFARVANFLIEIGGWTYRMGRDEDDGELLGFADLGLAMGPAGILANYQCKPREAFPYGTESTDGGCIGDLDSLFDNYLVGPLLQILESRNIKAPNEQDEFTERRILLDTVHGANDECQRCHTVRGLELWNQTNWDFLEEILRPGQIATLFVGQLSLNRFEKDSLTFELRKVEFPAFLSELLDIKTPKYDDWKPEDWACQKCITDLISANLHIWFLEHKRRVGLEINVDCRYGYNCRTQVRDHQHAAKLNHLCAPQRKS